jgi:hypothetical protein
MRSRLFPEPAAALLLVLAAGCNSPAPARAAGASAPRSLPQPSAFFLGPGDFEDGHAVFDVEPAPGGVTFVEVVPALAISDYRAQRHLEALVLSVTASAQPIDRVERRADHPLPRPHASTVPPAASPVPAAVVPAETRPFRMWSSRAHRYVEVPAHRSYLGASYAFYDDDTNVARFSMQEYATMNAVLESWWPALVARFGPPTDLDHDGHVLVLVSRTAIEAQPDAQGMMDRCSLFADGDCLPGENLIVWSLDGFPASAEQRVGYVSDYFPRVLLHETVHLTQQAPAVRAHLSWPEVVQLLPAWVPEGQAQLMRFVSGVGKDELWIDLRSALLAGGPLEAPYFRPYVTGALPFLWAEQQVGGDVQRAFIEASLHAATADPFAAAFGVPEPLALAEAFASLRFDGTPFGRDSGLDFPDDDVPRRLGAPLPRTALPIDGRPVTAEVRCTGHNTFEIVHGGPVRVTVATSTSDAAYVLVARP